MIKDIESIIKTITSEIKQFTDVAVVGMSGGADSTLVAILCKLALGAENVHAIHMPYDYVDEETFNKTSSAIAKRLGIRDRVRPIKRLADSIVEAIASDLNIFTEMVSEVNKGNARSRARMNILYGVAHHLGDSLNKRVRVIGTGNLSEDWIYYDTKFGDSAADIFPIGELYKSEVYQLLDYFRDEGLIVEEMINRTPSAGFGWTDEEELGFSYNEMQPSIERMRKLPEHFISRIAEGKVNNINGFPLTELDVFVAHRHITGKHKHDPAPVIHVRDIIY